MKRNKFFQIFFIALFVCLWVRSHCQNKTFRLGSNLIKNPNFQLPDINPEVTEYKYFDFQIDSWKCGNKCQLLSVPYICQYLDKRYCPFVSTRQILDTQSNNLDTIFQTINLQRNATYKLSLKWLPPQAYPLQKVLLVWVNQTIVSTIYINQYNYQIAQFNHLNLNIVLPAGDLVLKLQSLGQADTYGIYVDNIFLAEYIEINDTYNEWKDSLEQIFANKFVQIRNKYPGSRVFFRMMMNFYINFDRLQFYYYHNHNFTDYSLLLISRAYLLLNQKGTLFKIMARQYNHLSMLFDGIVDLGQSFKQKLRFKERYRNNYLYKRNQNGGEFVENQFDFFYYEVPFSIISFLLCFGLFKIMSRYKVSLQLRKYCFVGILFLIFFEGNVEEFTFYALLEMKQFFSATFLHKWVNAMLTTFWFAVVFFSFAVLPFCFFCYGRRIKYLMEDFRPMVLSLIAASIDSGIVPLVSGFIHALFLERLWETTVLLVLMELIWAMVRGWFMYRKLYAHNARVFIQIAVGLLRVCLLITLYLFEQNGSSMMNDIHFFVVCSYIIFWILQTLLSIFLFLKSLPMLFIRIRNYNSRIFPIQQKVLLSKKHLLYSKKQTHNMATNTGEFLEGGNKIKWRIQQKSIYILNRKQESYPPMKRIKKNIFFS